MKTYDTFELVRSEDADEVTIMLVARQWQEEKGTLREVPGAVARFVRRLSKLGGSPADLKEDLAKARLGDDVGEFIVKRFRA